MSIFSKKKKKQVEMMFVPYTTHFRLFWAYLGIAQESFMRKNIPPIVKVISAANNSPLFHRRGRINIDIQLPTLQHGCLYGVGRYVFPIMYVLNE